MEPDAEQSSWEKWTAFKLLFGLLFNSASDEHILTKTQRNDTVYFSLFSITESTLQLESPWKKTMQKRAFTLLRRMLHVELLKTLPSFQWKDHLLQLSPAICSLELWCGYMVVHGHPLKQKHIKVSRVSLMDHRMMQVCSIGSVLFSGFLCKCMEIISVCIFLFKKLNYQ